jgi:hypothetical protein
MIQGVSRSLNLGNTAVICVSVPNFPMYILQLNLIKVADSSTDLYLVGLSLSSGRWNNRRDRLRNQRCFGNCRL